MVSFGGRNRGAKIMLASYRTRRNQYCSAYAFRFLEFEMCRTESSVCRYRQLAGGKQSFGEFSAVRATPTKVNAMTMAAFDAIDGTDANDGDEGQEQDHQSLALLICSANIGNAEPTRESFDAWIPNDGRFVVGDGGGCGNSGDGSATCGSNAHPDDDDYDDGDETGNGRCCIVDDEDADEDNTKRIQKFDIIVIGMQEAAFLHDNSFNNNKSEHEDGSTKSSKLDVPPDENDNVVKEVSSGIIDEGNVVAEGALDCVETTTYGVLLDTVNDGVTELRKGSEKSGRRVVQNIGRGNLFMRGLGISSPKLPLPRTIVKT